MEIYIENNQKVKALSIIQVEVLNRALMRASELYDLENYEMSIVFVDNTKIQEINRVYRGKDQATDVISFALNDDESTFEWEKKELGDIYISIEKAEEQAKEYGHSFERELVYLAVHGLLHLLGFDHLEEDEKKEMRQAEEEIMDYIGLFRE